MTFQLCVTICSKFVPFKSPVRVDEVNDADGGADEKTERSGDENAPEAPAHLELEHDILKDERYLIIVKCSECH